jgi:hypothetical protein
VAERELVANTPKSSPPVPVAMAVVGAVMMPTSLFLHWYSVKAQAGGRDFSEYNLDGWQVFESTDTLMVLVAIATVALAVTRPRLVGSVLLLLGVLTSGWIVVQLIDGPPALAFFDRSDYSLQIGAWLGLLGALLTTGAGLLSRSRPNRVIRS